MHIFYYISHKPENYSNKNSLNLFEENIQSDFRFTTLPQEEYLFFKNPTKSAAVSQIKIDEQDLCIYKANLYESGILLEKNADIIIRNGYPLAKYHMIFLPFFLKNYPQYINKIEIITRVLSIFTYFSQRSEDNLVMAYNSKGASSSINSLHFQIILLSEFNINYSQMYIRQENYFDVEILIFEKDFDKYTEQDTDKLGIAIAFCKKDNHACCFRISINCDSCGQACTHKSIMNTFAKIIYKVINILNQESIPYNIIFLNNEVFVFIRKHQSLMDKSWLGSNELLGLILVYTKEEYEAFNSNSLSECLKCSMLSDEIINEVNEKVNQCFRK